MLYWAAFCNNEISAQTLDPQVLNNYPHGVSIQVFDIVVKTKTAVSRDRQIAIADLLLQKENEVFNDLMANEPDSVVIATKIDFDDQINDLLDSEQKFNRYISTTKENAKNKYSYSQFSAGIRYKDSLNLTATQVTTLQNYVDSVKLKKNQHYAQFKKSLDTRAYESKNMKQILPYAQYIALLKLKNKRRAIRTAENDWKELQLRHADSSFTQVQVIADLTSYYIAKACLYDKFQDDIIKQKAEVRELYEHRPRALRLLEKARRNPDNDTAIKLYKW
jgi:hypothetical protein